MKLMMVMVATTMTKVVVLMLIVMTMALFAQYKRRLQQKYAFQNCGRDLGPSIRSTLSMPILQLARAKARPTLTPVNVHHGVTWVVTLLAVCREHVCWPHALCVQRDVLRALHAEQTDHGGRSPW